MSVAVKEEASGKQSNFDLFDGRLHMPTIANYFRLVPSSVKIDNSVPPVDAIGFTFRVFNYQETVIISGEAVQEASAQPAYQPDTKSVTIVIYDPHKTPDTYSTTFKNPQKFEKFLDRGAITS
eukprot:CAMPEP_0202896746 /NCGR_PEP_ID=MMETSP1392-20130828/5684_1 /ASSEMBLY_ACC=CAM_ASM_000868 /TAXON_ID=225041 /ORGANISM="Chlamydomonas chlamydogama, Strain SAG 11-48b" /LENGTH=122 /DNA_ID=CAMNT_0049582203 /DNA_START=57 /DNA_END=422 /DNA_ORIENTATION=-